MHTLFITRGYPSEKYKTNGIFELDQAKALVEHGCKVVYAAIDLRSIRRCRKWGIEKKYINGVEIYAINIPLGRIPRNMLRKFGAIGLKILYNKIIKEHGKPDIMHAHFTNPAYIASKLKDATKIPLVVTEHSSKINKDKINQDLFNIANIAYNKADCLITVSPSLAKTIHKNFDINSTYVPNIVDLEIFKYTMKTKTEGFNFVSTGNLIATKNMDLTIKAFYEAFKDNPKVTLTIFGQGPEQKKLEDIINKYDLKTQVRLMGLRSRERIAEQLKVSDCFVLASQSETFGVSYIEALAMGVPVIATKCGGPEAFVNENNGLIIDVNNMSQLVESMIYMYNNIDKFDGEGISVETKEKFSSEVITPRIIDLYSRVLN